MKQYDDNLSPELQAAVERMQARIDKAIAERGHAGTIAVLEHIRDAAPSRRAVGVANG